MHAKKKNSLCVGNPFMNLNRMNIKYFFQKKKKKLFYILQNIKNRLVNELYYAKNVNKLIS